MLKKPGPTLLSQHGKKIPSTTSWLPAQAPKRLEQRSSAEFGWRPYGIMTGREEMLFEAYPERFINDPRFAGRGTAQLGATQTTHTSLRLTFFSACGDPEK